MNPKVNVPSNEQIIKVLKSVGIDPDIDIGSIPFVVTDEQEEAVADALMNLMVDGLSDDDKAKILEQMKSTYKNGPFKMLPDDVRKEQITEIKRRMGYEKYR